MTRQYKLRNSKTLIVRQGRPADAEGFIDYANQVAGESDFLTFNAGEFDESVEFQRMIIEELNDKTYGLFLIAEMDGEVAGNLTFRLGMRTKVSHAGEFGLTVKKQYWNLGIGRILIQTLIDWAHDSGNVRKINLKVREDNWRGIALYKKLGFSQEGILKREFYSKGVFFDALAMGLCIDLEKND
ncbi:acyl-coa n-acyltransferase [Lucifera butyrica]|uniref:Acyl-coa n-acyltransferase n=1 Tax=Lucifera butyrica TaxID=1351585 RepID=A0A498R9B4_9FIRM|nr:GNAT family N-acetyltransferase [Lucifera butyrica]VBB07585.1 acyl-coa n-acyltransferase [Lucifera butyrica]